MKTLLKIKKLLILGLVAMTQAEGLYALEGTTIECASVLSPLHKLSLNLTKEIFPQNAHNQRKFESVFHSLRGPRLAGQRYKVITVVEQIYTRTITGTSFSLSIENLGELVLQDLVHHTLPSGFTGTYTATHGSVPTQTILTCKYL